MSYFVYILSNEYGNVTYVDFTGNLRRRVYEHKHELVDGFTKKYHVHQLVYYEVYSSPKEGIAREKQIKKYSKKKKRALIDGMNPQRKDLYEEINE